MDVMKFCCFFIRTVAVLVLLSMCRPIKVVAQLNDKSITHRFSLSDAWIKGGLILISNLLNLHETKYLKKMLMISFFIISAVKFGRMSKKQREKVEDEVRFHRAQMRAQSDAAPDSSVFDTQTPSSSDQLHHGYNGWVIAYNYYKLFHKFCKKQDSFEYEICKFVIIWAKNAPRMELRNTF